MKKNCADKEIKLAREKILRSAQKSKIKRNYEKN